MLQTGKRGINFVMLKSTIVLKRSRLKHINFDYREIVAFTLFLCGIVIGCITVSRAGEAFLKSAYGILQSYLSVKSSIGFVRDALNISAIFLCVPVLMLFFGFSAAGIPFISLLTATFGTASGFFITLIMKSYGSAGVAFSTLSIIPGLALCTLSVIKCGIVGAEISHGILKIIFEKDGKTDNVLDLRGQIKKAVFNMLPSVVGALINAATFEAFKSLFDFIV